jgi:hypothetical protein
MTIKDVIAYCLVISLGIILAIHFVMFWVYGGVFIYEDNKTILILETMMSVAIFGFGIERLVASTGRQHNAAPRRAADGEAIASIHAARGESTQDQEPGAAGSAPSTPTPVRPRQNLPTPGLSRDLFHAIHEPAQSAGLQIGHKEGHSLQTSINSGRR